MTYGQFLLFLLLPAIALSLLLFTLRVLSATAADRTRMRNGLLLVAVLVVVAVAYTARWDRWLIEQQVWTYPPGSVIGTIGLVPIEEYLFMVGQTVLTACWALTVTANTTRVPPIAYERRLRIRYLVGWLVLTAALACWAFADQHALYAAAILVWFGPLIALQCAVGADVLRVARSPRMVGLSVTVLLWALDSVAIQTGAWQISTRYTVGVQMLGLPLEEGMFFLVTNMLIVNSIVLVSHPAMRQRLAGWLPSSARRRPSVES